MSCGEMILSAFFVGLFFGFLLSRGIEDDGKP